MTEKGYLHSSNQFQMTLCQTALWCAIQNCFKYVLGNYWGSVGRVAAPETRDPQFKSTQELFLFTFYLNIFVKKRRKSGWE